MGLSQVGPKLSNESLSMFDILDGRRGATESQQYLQFTNTLMKSNTAALFPMCIPDEPLLF